MTSSSGWGENTSTRSCAGSLARPRILSRSRLNTWPLIGPAAPDRAGDDARLVLARRQQRDFLGIENRRDAHGDRFARHVVDAKEIRRGVFARQRIERDDPRARRRVGPGLVESDVTRLADAEQLEVDPAGGAARLLVLGAGLHYALARRDSRRDVDVLLRDVHMREEVLPHVTVVAVRAVRRHRVVLVQIERDDARKIDVARLMAADQLFVDTERRAAGRETEHDPALRPCLALNDFDDALGHRDREVRVLGEDDRTQPLALTRAFDGNGVRACAMSGSLGHYTFTSMVAPRLYRTYSHAMGTINMPAAMMVSASKTADSKTACWDACAAWNMAESCLASSTIIA